MQTDPSARRIYVMKTSLIAALATAVVMPIAFAADEPAKEKSLLQKTGDSVESGVKKTGDVLESGARKTGDVLESGARKTGETLKKAGDKAVDLVTTSEDEKKKEKADAARRSADDQAERAKNAR